MSHKRSTRGQTRKPQKILCIVEQSLPDRFHAVVPKELREETKNSAQAGELTQTPTHPYNIHEILIKYQMIDFGYELEV